MTIADDLIFETVVLSVDAAGENEGALWQFRGVFLAACHDAVLIFEVSTIFPEFAEQSVVNDLQAFRVVLRFEEALSYDRPRHPRTGEGVQPEGSHAAPERVGVFCDPSRRLIPHDVLRC